MKNRSEMRQHTGHRITLSIEEMESILRKMHEHRAQNDSLSARVTLDLDYDTDYETLRIADRRDNAYQYNSYYECNGKRFTV